MRLKVFVVSFVSTEVSEATGATFPFMGENDDYFFVWDKWAERKRLQSTAITAFPKHAKVVPKKGSYVEVDVPEEVWTWFCAKQLGGI